MIRHFGIEEINKMSRFYRANFINALSGFKAAQLIGTKSKSGIENLALFQNIVHLGADPALIGCINRPREATPHTLSNIEQTGYFTLNAIHSDWIQKAHQTSAKFPENVSEFSATGLTPTYKNDFHAPYVGESMVQCGLETIEIIPIQHNGTFLIIGKVIEVWLEDTMLKEDGFISLEQQHTICSLGLDGYYEPQLLQRIPYAKP